MTQFNLGNLIARGAVGIRCRLLAAVTDRNDYDCTKVAALSARKETPGDSAACFPWALNRRCVKRLLFRQAVMGPSPTLARESSTESWAPKVTGPARFRASGLTPRMFSQPPRRTWDVFGIRISAPTCILGANGAGNNFHPLHRRTATYKHQD